MDWQSAEIEDPDEIDMNVDPNRAELFYAAVRKYWSGLQDNNLVPDYSGIRPKLLHPDVVNKLDGGKDFMICGPEQHGVPGLTVLLGIESPG